MTLISQSFCKDCLWLVLYIITMITVILPSSLISNCFISLYNWIKLKYKYYKIERNLIKGCGT